MSRDRDIGVFFMDNNKGLYFFRVFLTKIGFLRINPCKREMIILKYIVSSVIQKIERWRVMSLINNLVEQLINGLRTGSIYALIALGYTMVYGIAKMINFAHGDIIMVGAYALYVFAGAYWRSSGAGMYFIDHYCLCGSRNSGENVLRTNHCVTRRRWLYLSQRSV